MVGIETLGLQKTFGATCALNGVSVVFEPGLMHGVIGPEGAGKSTLFRHLMSLLKPSAGSIRYQNNLKPCDFSEIRLRMGYMPQQQSLYPDLSIEEHLDFFKELYGLSDSGYAEKRARLLEITRLGKFLDRPAGKLSGGMYKKLGLMCALLSSPAALLLDEPTNGVDPISRREFWELLHGLKEQKILILIATAYMDEAERCTRVHLLDRGQLVASGEPRDLLEREKVKNFDEFFLKRAREATDV